MRSARRVRGLVGLLVLASLVLTACAQATPTPEKVVETVEVEKQVEKIVQVTPTPGPYKPVGTLRVALSTFPNSLYLPMSAERNAHNASWQLYDSLVYMNEAGEIEPALAEKWDVSEDGTEYTFTLREGVTFHNGEAFTADDVVASWEWGKKDDMAWSEKWQMAKSVEKVDDYTVKVTTEGPKPLLLRSMTTFWAMTPEEYMDEVGLEGFYEHPVGTGPFMFEEWVKGDHITYSANPDYWREEYPKAESLIFRPIPESATRTAAIQTDEVDIVGRLTAEEAQSLLGVPGVKVIKYPLARIWYVAFNNLTSGVDEPTEDAKVRQAMNYAVDVDAIIEAIFQGYGKPATGYVATGELGYGIVEPFGYDPDKAMALLEEAGFGDGFEMDMACPAGAYSHFEEVCEAIVGYLSEVGIDVTLEIMESGHYWDLEASKELPPLFGDSWSEVSGEAYNRLKGALGGWDASYSSWSDPTIDDYLNKISTEVDLEKRKQLYEDLQVYMQENPPFIYLYEQFTFEATRTRVHNYQPRPAEDYFLFQTWVLTEE